MQRILAYPKKQYGLKITAGGQNMKSERECQVFIIKIVINDRVSGQCENSKCLEIKIFKRQERLQHVCASGGNELRLKKFKRDIDEGYCTTETEE